MALIHNIIRERSQQLFMDKFLELSPPLQPGHAFLSLTYARQSRQFIPQGAISVVGMAFVFMDPIRVIPIYRNGLYACLSIEAQHDGHLRGGRKEGLRSGIHRVCEHVRTWGQPLNVEFAP